MEEIMIAALRVAFSCFRVSRVAHAVNERLVFVESGWFFSSTTPNRATLLFTSSNVISHLQEKRREMGGFGCATSLT
jgi:hypothetical protein